MPRFVTMILLGAMLFGTACEQLKEGPEKDGPAKDGPAKDTAAVAILERAVASMGGDAALAKIEGMKLGYEGSYDANGMSSPFTSEMIFVRPDRMLWTLDAGMFNASVGTAGGVSWAVFMEPVARAKGVRAESIAEWPDHQDLMLVRPLLTRDDIDLRMGETKEPANGREETVHVKFGEGHEYAFTFLTNDRGTFPRLLAGPQTQMDGRVGAMEFRMSVPKEFDGITLPTEYESISYLDGELSHSMTEKLVSVEWNPELPEGTFAMPKLAMALEVIAAKTTEATTGLVVIHEGAYDTISETIGRAFALAAQTGATPMSTAICVYLEDPATVKNPAELRTEVIIPLMVMGPPPKAPEGSEIREIPKMEVASVTVKGPYGTRTGEWIGKLAAWAGEKKRTPAGPPRVVYFHNPALVLDEDQVSEFQLPIQ